MSKLSPLGLTSLQNANISYNNSDKSVGVNSIFNGSKFFYKPVISSDKSNNDSPNLTRSSKTHQGRGNLSQSDSIYDISTESIINYIENNNLNSMRLRFADFVYLRNLGVYPNNRLVVIRRFPSPVEDDLTNVSISPIATVLSYAKDTGDSLFDFSFGEAWQVKNKTADPLKELTEIFNNIFQKAIGQNAPGEVEGQVTGIAKRLPIGGVAEALQTSVMNYLLGDRNPDGTFSNGTNFQYNNIPQGNPNFMAESAFRNINSIASDVKYNIVTEYELKFIPGVDPTIVYMDIIQNILRLVGSESVFYISQTGGAKINQFFNEYGKGNWVGAIGIVVESITDAVGRLAEQVGKAISSVAKAATEGFSAGGSAGAKDAVLQEGIKAIAAISETSLARYRIDFARIIPAASGAPSAPWHITIGNPKNPIFSSGDMVIQNAKVKMGNTLGFNDLPTKIEVSFEIESARNLGIQEIFSKFNTGGGRQYQKSNIRFQGDFYSGQVNAKTDSTTNPVSGAGA